MSHGAFSVSLVLIIWPGCALLARGPASAPVAPASLPSTAVVRQEDVELEVAVSPWATASGPVALSCILSNRNQQDVHMYPYAMPSLVPSKEPWFRIIVLDERGYSLEYTREGVEALTQRPGLTLPRTERIDIPPGQQFRQDYDLSRWFKFPGPGSYRVSVRRHVAVRPRERLDLRVEASVRIIDAPDNK